VFLDEIDALVSARSETGDSSGGVQQRMLAALLNEMDGIDRVAGVLVVSNCTFVSLTTDIIGSLRCLGRRANGGAVSQRRCCDH
jgi:SpoVK/Ycf46/Vps4 family AAA+-type ATPase